MAVSVASRAQAEAIALAVKAFTGSRPALDEDANSITVQFKPDQVKQLQKLLNDWLDSRSGPVQVNVAPVIIPVMVRRILPWLLGGASIAGILVYTMRKK